MPRHLTLWHRHQYYISTREGHQQSVDGIRMSDSHFGIHFALDTVAVTVTHLPSGRRLHPAPGFKSLSRAVSFAEALAEMAGVNWAEPDIQLSPEQAVEALRLFYLSGPNGT